MKDDTSDTGRTKNSRKLYLDDDAYAALQDKAKGWDMSSSEIVSSLMRLFCGRPYAEKDAPVLREVLRLAPDAADIGKKPFSALTASFRPALLPIFDALCAAEQAQLADGLIGAIADFVSASKPPFTGKFAPVLKSQREWEKISPPEKGAKTTTKTKSKKP